MTATLVAAPSLEDLLTRSGPEAVALSGAAQSAWNGQVIEATGEVLGLAHWDGTLYLGDTILDPLRQMYERSGEQQPIPDLVRYRESLATILHEQAHFLGPAGATQEAARGAFTQPGGRQLEEGVAEAWAQDHLNEFLTRLGVDKVAPGINDVTSGGYYPAYVPAVRILTTDLENRAGLNRGEVLNALNRQTAEGQLPLLVTLLYNSSRLPDLDTPAEAVEVRARLEAHLRNALPQLDAFELHPPGFAAARSRSTTGALLTHLHTELQASESAHTPHPTACALPTPATPATPVTPTPSRLVPTPHHTALSALAPPTHHPPSTPPTRANPHTRNPTPARALAR
ncbi:hypothetical protein ACGFIF_35215 [Kribbella sp. NPDC049174]|uniref:hypothetical protein n=1 Tax=Kribbella sp. NPDC049174 TaxID=3364112 RepID=UPI00371BC03A